MSDDWKVGDLALCVSRGDDYPPHVVPGACFSVSDVFYNIPDETKGDIGTALLFNEAGPFGDDFGYCAKRFIKVTPPEADAFDHETIELTNRKPVEAVS